MAQSEKMKRTNSFVLFGRAFKNAKNDFWVSIQVLFFITIGLAFIFWWVEGIAQPDVYGGISGLFQSFVWAFTRYIGDPGKFAGSGPVTLAGRWIDTAIGILKILIFAVPAGLVANGFRKAMEDDKRQQKLRDLNEKLHHAFRRVQNPHTLYKVVPVKKSIVTIQANQRIDTKDVLDAVDFSKDMRLRNMASTYSMNEEPQDRLVVELFPLTKDNPYGCFIDRKSNVTIVSTSSVQEMGTGHFAYYLALYGDFNYISKEIEVNPDEPVSYYNIEKDQIETLSDKDGNKPLKQFLDDIQKLATNDNHWVIFILSTSKTCPTQLHFIHRLSEKIGTTPTTVVKEEQFMQMYQEVEQMLTNTDYPLTDADQYEPLSSDLDEYFRPAGPKNIATRLGGGTKLNAFTIRAAWKLTARDNRSVSIARRLAEIMANHFSDKPFKENKELWKKSGEGFLKKEEENNTRK